MRLRRVKPTFKVLVLGSLCTLLVGTVTWYSRFGPHDDSFSEHERNFYREAVVQSPDVNNNNNAPPSDDDDDGSRQQQVAARRRDDPEAFTERLGYTHIDCVVNDEYKVDCRREADEVFVPFAFIKKYFDIYGGLKKGNGKDKLIWSHSYSTIHDLHGKYTPDGFYLYFDGYNVEYRKNVKCISGVTGVPVSRQWGEKGYYYATQVAQYGLSHYSKHILEPEPVREVLEDAEAGGTDRWGVHSHRAAVHNAYNAARFTRVIEFEADESLSDNSVTFSIGEPRNFFLSLDFRFANNGSFTVIVESKGKEPTQTFIHYVCSDTFIYTRKNHIYYGIGSRQKWTRIHRDVRVDVYNGLMVTNKNVRKEQMGQIKALVFRGRGWVDNITLSDQDHVAAFFYTADWLLDNQDERGGWPVSARRVVAKGVLEIPPGWYGAMCQGHAISVLVRAYIKSRREEYLHAAVRATELFDVPSTEGGVLAVFADKYKWYEEYPTVPSLFVLNGFIYSLFGLYDLRSVAPDSPADRLYATGMESLKALLPLFDTGTGSVYDLRHFTAGLPPNRARWDYHAAHIQQLLYLDTIDESPIFKTIADRWTEYKKGNYAPHN